MAHYLEPSASYEDLTRHESLLPERPSIPRRHSSCSVYSFTTLSPSEHDQDIHSEHDRYIPEEHDQDIPYDSRIVASYLDAAPEPLYLQPTTYTTSLPSPSALPQPSPSYVSYPGVSAPRPKPPKLAKSSAALDRAIAQNRKGATGPGEGEISPLTPETPKNRLKGPRFSRDDKAIEGMAAHIRGLRGSLEDKQEKEKKDMAAHIRGLRASCEDSQVHADNYESVLHTRTSVWHNDAVEPYYPIYGEEDAPPMSPRITEFVDHSFFPTALGEDEGNSFFPMPLDKDEKNVEVETKHESKPERKREPDAEPEEEHERQPRPVSRWSTDSSELEKEANGMRNSLKSKAKKAFTSHFSSNSADLDTQKLAPPSKPKGRLGSGESKASLGRRVSLHHSSIGDMYETLTSLTPGLKGKIGTPRTSTSTARSHQPVDYFSKIGTPRTSTSTARSHEPADYFSADHVGKGNGHRTPAIPLSPYQKFGPKAWQLDTPGAMTPGKFGFTSYFGGEDRGSPASSRPVSRKGVETPGAKVKAMKRPGLASRLASTFEKGSGKKDQQRRDDLKKKIVLVGVGDREQPGTPGGWM